MQIQKNSRQVPKNIDITSNKIYSDILYSYLQTISCKDENNVRYLTREQVNFKNLAKELNISRQTVSKKFNNLVSLGLIMPSKKYKYELPPILPKDAFLIPQETLRIMVNSLAERTVSIYIYLINRWFATGQEPYDFTITSLKAYCGMSIKTESNNTIVTDILKTLKKLDLIDFSLVTNLNKDKFYTYYHLDNIKLTI